MPFVLAAVEDTFVSVLILVSIALGYLIIWMIWRKAFRGRTVEANELVAEPMNRAGRDLTEELWELEVWLRRRLPEAGWERVAVTEVDMSTDPVARHDAAVAPEAFVARFSEILHASQRDAVALEALAIEDGRLLVAVNWASEPRAGEGRRARLPVTVQHHASGNLDTTV